MTVAILLVTSLVAVLLVAALVREVRLRQAMQSLVSRTLSCRRNPGERGAASGRSYFE